MTFLERILQSKREEVATLHSGASKADLQRKAADMPPARDFVSSLRAKGLSIIAEIKKASPSRGPLKSDAGHLELAKEYTEGGASALSVLTDSRFFGGYPSLLKEVSEISPLPILRKDFIIDEFQVYESRILRADAVLLIVRILSPELLHGLFDLTVALGMTPFLEVHDEREIESANALKAPIIGINNRDLSDFSVSMSRSIRLRRFINPNSVSVSESGIKNENDVRELRRAGFDAVLIGETLVEHHDRVSALRKMMIA